MEDAWKCLTLIIAVGGSYIAYQQFRLGRERFKLDLFERRFAVFAGVRRFLSEILRDAKFEYEQLGAFRASTAETSFLFGDDVISYIDEIERRAMNMKKLGISRKDETSDQKRLAQVHAENDELTWLIDQLPLLKVRFAPYLKFETWT